MRGLKKQSRTGELCLLCGLCCDGSLFDNVALTEAEAQALIERDVAVGLRGGSRYVLEQRCDALKGTCCTAYDVRPDGCRKYHCLLVTALETDEVSFDDAAGVVAEAHRKLLELDVALPPSDGAPSSAVRRVTWANVPGSGRAMSPAAVTAWTALREFLRARFTGRYGAG